MVEHNVKNNTLCYKSLFHSIDRGEKMYRFVVIRSYFRPKQGWYVRTSELLQALKELGLDASSCEGEGCSPMVAEILDHKMRKGACVCEL